MPKKVTKAVIVAAGLGKRMFPFTKIDSKLLIPILNKPIALYLMEELHASGIKDVLIVTNHSSKLKQLFEKDSKLDNILEQLDREDLIRELHRIENLCRIKYIIQEEPRGWLHAVTLAKDFVKKQPFVVLFSDCLFKSKIPATKQIIKKYYEINKNIHALGRYLFKPDIFKLIKDMEFPLGEDTADTIVLSYMDKKNEVEWYDIVGRPYDVGDPIQLLRTLLTFTLEDWYYSDKLKELINSDKDLKADFKKFYNRIKKIKKH